MRLDEPIERRAGERLGESVDHRLLEDLGGAIGVLDADFDHDLVVQPRDRTALDAGLEQPLVDISERQHRGVGAGALNRQIAAASVEALALGQPGLKVMAPDSSRGVASNDDSAGILAALGVLVLPGVELWISLLERLHPLLGLRRGEHEAVVVPRRPG